MRTHVAAEQQKPPLHALGPVQSAVQLLPLQSRSPAHEPVPRHVMRFIPAFTSTPFMHDIEPMQLMSHMFPEHVVVAGHDPDPEHTIAFDEPSALMPLRHELIPPHVTLQVEPPHWMPPVHALLPHVIVQASASRQSIPAVQPDAGHVIAHGMSDGHLI